MAHPDWNNLKYFLAVARSGGLTPAVASLNTSPSTVSRHIDAMEAALGVRLFLRQQLTDTGSAFLEHVAEVERAGDWRRLPHVSWDAAWVKLPMVEWLQTLFPGQTPVFRSNTLQAHLLAARSGLGAALLPSFMGESDDRLLRLDTAALSTQQELWLMYHRDLKASRRVLAMRDFVEEVCRRELAKYG